MKVIGLTGGIASGKSAVGRMLREAGVPVIDADQLAREVMAPGMPAFADVVARWGTDVLAADGTLDRKKLGAIVFHDDGARRELNAMTHPRVAALAMAKLQELAASGAAAAVYEVPLLFENNLERMVDATILVAAPLQVQLERLMKRDGLAEVDARARIAAQMPLEEKRRRATATIENTGTLDELRRALEEVWRRVSA